MLNNSLVIVLLQSESMHWYDMLFRILTKAKRHVDILQENI